MPLSPLSTRKVRQVSDTFILMYDKGFEAGVQAERERIAGELEARIEKAEKALPALGDSVAGKMQRAGIGAFRAALAVVTGKGASDE
jgi:hypothetical protein